MEPISMGALAAGGGSIIGAVAFVWNTAKKYGKDRADLNGTVERVKKIETKLDAHMIEEAEEFQQIHDNLTELNTKMDLLLDNRII